jgi:hypothetical protein
MDRPRFDTGEFCPALLKLSVTYVAREADRIGPSSLRNVADVALFIWRASSCCSIALRGRQADPGETRSSELSTSVTEILTRFAPPLSVGIQGSCGAEAQRRIIAEKQPTQGKGEERSAEKGKA